MFGSSDVGENEHQPLQLLDADGNDVTPRSLVNPSVTLHSDLIQQRASASDPSSSKGGNFGIGTVARQSHALLGGRQNKKGRPTNQSIAESDESIDMPFSKSFVASSMRSNHDDGESNHQLEIEGDGDTLVSGISDVRTYHAVIKQEQEKVSEEELDNVVDICLTESDIIWMFDQPSTLVLGNTEEAETVKQANERYDKIVNEYETNHDMVAVRFAQTLHLADKHKACQVSAVETTSVACAASEASIFDTYAALDQESEKPEAEGKISSAAGGSAVQDPLAKESGTQTSTPDDDDTQRLTKLKEVPGFATKLQLTERIVVHANPKCAAGQQLYKGVPEIHAAETGPSEAVDVDSGTQADAVSAEGTTGESEAVEEESKTSEESKASEEEAARLASLPTFEQLWTYKCSLTDGLEVTSTVWNPTNKDILAAGYGLHNPEGLGVEGLVCCWSFKNPQYVYLLIVASHSVPCGLNWK